MHAVSLFEQMHGGSSRGHAVGLYEEFGLHVRGKLVQLVRHLRTWVEYGASSSSPQRRELVSDRVRVGVGVRVMSEYSWVPSP